MKKPDQGGQIDLARFPKMGKDSYADGQPQN
jgi:hypothetical protein